MNDTQSELLIRCIVRVTKTTVERRSQQHRTKLLTKNNSSIHENDKQFLAIETRTKILLAKHKSQQVPRISKEVERQQISEKKRQKKKWKKK